MIIIWSAFFGILIFLGILLIALLLGAAANRAEKEVRERTAAERKAGLTGDFTSDTPDPIHGRYLEA